MLWKTIYIINLLVCSYVRKSYETLSNMLVRHLFITFLKNAVYLHKQQVKSQVVWEIDYVLLKHSTESLLSFCFLASPTPARNIWHQPSSERRYGWARQASPFPLPYTRPPWFRLKAGIMRWFASLDWSSNLGILNTASNWCIDSK